MPSVSVSLCLCVSVSACSCLCLFVCVSVSVSVSVSARMCMQCEGHFFHSLRLLSSSLLLGFPIYFELRRYRIVYHPSVLIGAVLSGGPNAASNRQSPPTPKHPAGWRAPEDGAGEQRGGGPPLDQRLRLSVRPSSVLRLWISEGLTRAKC